MESPGDIFRHDAEQVAEHGPHFVEGVGAATLTGMSVAKDEAINFNVIYEDRTSTVGEVPAKPMDVYR